MIKKALCSIGVIAGIIGILFGISYVEHNYTVEGFVYTLNDNYIILEDNTGSLWAYDFDEKITRDTLVKNEKVEIDFNDNCSNSNREDDIITNIRKIF